MIFELAFKQKELIKKPWELFFLAILTSSIGIVLSLVTFEGSESIVLITFSIIPLIPVVIDLIKSQEKTLIREEHLKLKKIFFKHFSYIFLGLTISYMLWFIALPAGVAEDTFSQQIISLDEISGPTGLITAHNNYPISNTNIANTDLQKYNQNFAKLLFLNNIQILIFIIITAIIFGAGAIFIIAWNASVIGVFIGGFVKSSSFFTQNPTFAFIYEVPRVVAQLVLHGIFEFGGFFCGAIAGSILGLAIVKHFRKNKSRKILIKDSILMILLAIVLIGIGAIIEAYV